MKIAGRISVFVLSFTILVSVSMVFATEKSDSCPTEFDPDNSAWAMHKIEIKERGSYRIHERTFSYFPNPEKRIFVGIKKIENPTCVAALVSYGPKDPDADGKRIWGAISSPRGIRYYLFINGAWEQGDDIDNTLSCDDAKKSCSIEFTLYKKKVPIASLAVIIR